MDNTVIIPREEQEPVRTWFRFCSNHCKNRAFETPGATLRVSSSTIRSCDYCGTYGSYYGDDGYDWTYVNADAVLVEYQECDCGDRIRHVDGGNYHYESWRIIRWL